MIMYVLFFYIHSLVGFDYNEQNDSQQNELIWESGKYSGVATTYQSTINH